ncbi:unnamed protein product [Mytilus coruscus]|uniref:C-type lectin domain-containing protein n=1 Tax=Mytilus coruscus TaxID=42192 RepID=A0A6J8AMC9_MYTCO|nr:unnamed protein product [Mytilus coruscus]
MQQLLTLICLVGPVSVTGQSCSYSYITGPFTWTDGHDRCMNAGMDLVVIKDQETYDAVNSYITKNGWTNDIWIGLLWNKIDLSFEWIDNVKLGSWTHWDVGEPNCMELTELEPEVCPAGNFYDQNCIRIRLKTNSWIWKTHECYNRYSVLCQSCTGTTIASSSSSNTVESDYNTKLQTGQHASSTQTTTPTLNTSSIGKDNCKSKSNGCQCQKRMSNTTESVKITDYIWLRKCEVQPLIDSGVLNEIDCPYTCSCSSRDTNETNSVTHEMFACIKRR